jgi:hypothetical protein
MVARASLTLLLLCAGCKTRLLDLPSEPAPESQPLAVAVALGERNSCARLPDGTAQCWGSFGRSQTVCSDTPSKVPGVTGALGLFLGSGTACVEWAGNHAGCWDGCWILDDHVPPTPIANLDGNVQLAFDPKHGCARFANGTIRCWTGEILSSPLPLDDQPVGGLPESLNISNGADECAALTDGVVSCWGPDALAAFPVQGIKNAAAVAGSDVDDCALLPGGTVSCWGPTGIVHPIDGITGAVAIVAGNSHHCALLGDATVRCWGDNTYGQLGDGTTNPAASSVGVGGLGEVKQIAAGAFHTCAVLTDGTVRCWGHNDLGQLGDGTQQDRLAPVTIALEK